MRYPDQHLSADELESLGKGEGLSGGRGEDLGAAREHVQSCPSCRRRLEVYPNTGAKLEQLRAPKGTPKGPDCPPVEVWLNLAGGLLSTTERERYTTHAATCDHCGPVLREIVHDFEEPVTEEEKAALAGLKSSGTIPQHKSTTRVVPPKPVPHPWRWFGLPGWQVAAAAAVILATVSFSLYKIGIFNKENSIASVDHLLAQAYTEQRTIELRIPDADYAPMRTNRGGTISNMDRPQSLLKAESLIRENLSKQRNNAVWLQAKARADLLDGNQDSAIASLQQARDMDPDSLGLLIDLATAYFQRATPTDYGTALNLLGQVLAKSPDNTVALFNRGIVCENLSLYQQAVDDWEHYLRLDSRSGWANEATDHLRRTQEKLHTHSDFKDELIRDPGTFLKQMTQQPNVGARSLSEYPDEYLDIATTEWLMNVVDPAVSAPKKEEVGAVLSFFANFMKKSRLDLWLSDMLADADKPGMFQAMESLTNAIRASQSGDYDSAIQEASQAERFFQRSESTAGTLRARFERVYALDRAGKGSLCRREAVPLITHPDGGRYLWLKIQSLSEDALCRSITGDLETASRESDRAVELAKSSGYHSLYLRALGNAASIDDLKGDFSKAWHRHLEGLKQYWDGSYAPARAFLFYSELSYVAEDEEQSYAAATLAREAVSAIVLAKNQNVEALARYRWASLAQAAGLEAEAREQFETADDMFSEIEHNSAYDKSHATVAAYHAAARVMLAGLEARRGMLDQSLVLLDEARPALSGIQNYTVPLQFYSILGELYSQQNKQDAALKALRSAIAIGEIGAHTIKGDRDRLVWEHRVGKTYRNLVKLLFLNDHKADEALDIWEWYRGLPLREGQISNSMWSKYAKEINFEQLQQNPLPPQPPSMTNVLPSLKTMTVLSYAQMDDGIAIWIFDNRGIISKWIPINHEDLERIISKFNRECSDPQSDFSALKGDAHRLYHWLIAPIAAQIDPARDILVEADGAIVTLAFEALVDDQGAYVGSYFAITGSPGVEYMKHLRPDDLVSSDLPALIVGPPALKGEIAGKFLPIPDATLEAEVIARRFHKTELLMGVQATVAAVKKSLPRAAVFHFAGHALAGEERNGLLLASEGPDEPSKISLLSASSLDPSLAANIRLVVLSACSTASVNVSRTGDPDNLVRYFFRAGVPHVVATRWDIDSHETANTMRSFYAALFSGNSVSQALRIVRRMLISDPSTSHPYYWASFSAFGRQ